MKLFFLSLVANLVSSFLQRFTMMLQRLIMAF